MKKSQKMIALLLSLTLMVLFSGTVFAQEAVGDGTDADIITPYYNNTNTCSTTLSISSTGMATAITKVTGISGKTTKIVMETYIDKKILGFIWVRVDNGQTDNTWVNTYNSYTATCTHKLQLTDKGDYRVKVKITVSGSGGSADVINQLKEAAYN